MTANQGAPVSFPVLTPNRLLEAANESEFYMDDPGSLGSGTYARSYPVRDLDLDRPLRVVELTGRMDFPAAAGETATIRLYRYRKLEEYGPFTYTQISSAFVMDNTLDWSWTYDFSANILDGFELIHTLDSVAVSNVYVSGGGPTMKALRVDFTLGLEE